MNPKSLAYESSRRAELIDIALFLLGTKGRHEGVLREIRKRWPWATAKVILTPRRTSHGPAPG